MANAKCCQDDTTWVWHISGSHTLVARRCTGQLASAASCGGGSAEAAGCGAAAEGTGADGGSEGRCCHEMAATSAAAEATVAGQSVATSAAAAAIA